MWHVSINFETWVIKFCHQWAPLYPHVYDIINCVNGANLDYIKIYFNWMKSQIGWYFKYMKSLDEIYDKNWCRVS
jgi:hypothetical protein